MASDGRWHSWIVSVLKIGLPLIALGLLAALFLVQTDDTIGGVVFSQGDVDALGEGLKVSNPIFTGTTRGEDRFRFTAALVVPDAAPPQRAAITDLAGTVDLHNGPQISVQAKTGDLDIPTQRLDMAGNVVITTSDGYRLDSDRATLDLRVGAVVAGNKVVGTGPLGQITSGSLHVTPADAKGTSPALLFRRRRAAAIRTTGGQAGNAMKRGGWRLAILAAAVPVLALAQGTQVPFGGLHHDASQPVEITADRLDVDQAAGSAVFTGTVKVGQGTLRLAADRVDVFYDQTPSAPPARTRQLPRPAATSRPAPRPARSSGSSPPAA